MTALDEGGRAGPDNSRAPGCNTGGGDPAITTPARHEIASMMPHCAGNDPLEVARRLMAMGVPVFAAAPALDADGNWDPDGGVGGYRLPPAWQKMVPTTNWLDPTVPGFETKAWRPGWALAAVMGVKVDCLDTDPRNGGDASRARLVEDGLLPTVYAAATTPSGGTHELIAPLGLGSKTGFLPGLDLKGGKADATSRGFIFIAPTMKASKVTGEIRRYVWTTT